jgi:hypothetical protein
MQRPEVQKIPEDTTSKPADTHLVILIARHVLNNILVVIISSYAIWYFLLYISM